MSHKIPKRHTDCRYCASEKVPCSSHAGPNGTYVEYAGHDVYEPSEWVLQVVGQRYVGLWQEGIYLCTGYDPRAGFWMDRLDGGRRTNISERAIDRTWHAIKMSFGAWNLLKLFEEKGFLEKAEAERACHAIYDMALPTLIENGLIDNKVLTPFAIKVLAAIPKADRTGIFRLNHLEYQ